MAEYSKPAADDLAALGAEFGLVVTSARPLDGGMANSSFVLEAGETSFVLTVLDNHSNESASALVRLLDHIAAAGVRTPTALRKTDGHRLSTWQDVPVVVKEFVPGSVCVPLPPDLLFDAGALLAHIHRVPTPAWLGRGTRRLPDGWVALVADSGRTAGLVRLLTDASGMSPS